MMKKIKNFELVTLALYACGGTKKQVDTEDIALKADEIDDQRFRWKKYKQHIDRGLIFDCLKTSKNRKLGSYVKGNDEKGWILTPEGYAFCEKSKDRIKPQFSRKIRLRKVEKKYIQREEYRITNTEAYNKYLQGKKAEITNKDIKRLFKVDDYTTKDDVQKRTVSLLENFKTNENIYNLINEFKKEAINNL